jgi:hypothetical protein
VSRPICNEPDCHARAWHRGYCNYHALQRRRAEAKGPSPTSKRSTHRRAEELGIKLAEQTAASARDEAAEVQSERSRTGRKVRSPVG